MKLLGIYEHTINGSMEEAKDRLVTQVIIRTKEDLLKVASLLNSQCLANEKNKTDKGKYIRYSIKLSNVMPIDDFVNNFENIRDNRDIVECNKQLKDSNKYRFIRFKEW